MEKIDITGVPETMLQTLYARAAYSQLPEHKFYDAKKAEIIMEIMSPFVVKHIKEKSIDATKARFTWGVKSGKEVERLVQGLHWVKDISLADGMVKMIPAYKLVAWIPAIRNMSNKLTILECET